MSQSDVESAVVTAVVETLRTIALWVCDEHRRGLIDMADSVERAWHPDVGACCPVCEEMECDAGCPLARVRAVHGGWRASC